MRSSLLQTIQSPLDPEVINLGIGNPQLEHLPLEMLQRAVGACFGRGERDFLQYGFEAGHGGFRLALANFLSRGYRIDVSPDELFVTSGISAALDLICTLFTQPGQEVWVEEPSYFLALRIFRDHHLKAVSIPVDNDGLQVDILEKKLKHGRPAFLYTVPEYQNPSGVTLSAERRLRLAALSQEYELLVVADEVYYLLGFASPPPPLAASQEGRILSLGSFSKILAPGLRLGWVQADKDFICRLSASGVLDSGGGMNPFASAVIREALENGWVQENVEHLRWIYRRRSAVMETALRSFLPSLEFTSPQGGYFYWVRLPDGVDAEELLSAARRHKVSFQPGVRFSSQGGLRDYIRLCFACYAENELEEGIRRLKASLDAL